MNPLLKRLAGLRRKVRLLDGWLGVCAVIALVLGVGVGVGAADFYLHLPSLFRAALLVALLVGTGYVGYWYIVRPFARSCDDLNLAIRIEEAFPELNDCLASTVQFLTQPAKELARVGGSPAMRERTVADTMKKADACDFSKILDRGPALIFGLAAFCVVLLTAGIVWSQPAYSATAFWRFVEPFGQHTWTRITVERKVLLELDREWEPIDPSPQAEDRVAIGRPYIIRVNLEGQMPRHKDARVEIRGQSTRDEKIIKIEPGKDGRSASFDTAIPMTNHKQEFEFRILANDGAFPPRAGTWHKVEVLPPPSLTKMANGKDSPQITLHLPKYTDLPSPKHLDAGDRHLKVIAGTKVVFRAKADRPLKDAWIEYQHTDEFLAKAAVAAFGPPDPIAALGQARLGQELWGRIPATFLDDAQTTFKMEFTPWIGGTYKLTLRDNYGLEKQYDGDLQVDLDPIPEVRVLAPTADQTRVADKTGKVNAFLDLEFQVTDEQFAIKTVFIEYRRKPFGAGDFEAPKRVVIYDAAEFGKRLPLLSNEAVMRGRPAHALVGAGAFGLLPDHRLRWQKIKMDTKWSLVKEFKEGDVVLIEVCADDFCDIYPTREAGRSHQIKLHILSNHGGNELFANDLAQILQRLKAIAKTQEEALAAVKQTRKLDTIDPKKDTEALFDKGVVPQKDVHARIGAGPTADHGVRNAVKKLREDMRVNGRTDSQIYKDAGKIAGTLQSLAQRELPDIDPKIADARNDLAKLDKHTPQSHKKLDDVARLQKNVLDALNELIGKLDPRAKMDAIRQKSGEILQKQKDLAKALELQKSIQEAQDKNPNFTPEEKKANAADNAKKLDGLRKDQLELAGKMLELVEEMKAAKKENEQPGGDPRAAKALQDALNKAVPPEEKKLDPKPMPKDKVDKTPIDAQMKDVADKLQNKKEIPQDPIQQQKDIAKQLERILADLEGNDIANAQQDIQDHAKVQDKIDDLLNKNKKLMDKNQQIQKIEDKEERLKQKQELAKEIGDLQQQVEEARRELARLNEQRDADKLKDVADKLDQAKQALQNDGNPEPQQRQAQEDLKKVKQDLKQVQEELARELLVKMADQLLGLKEREVASIERSEKFHVKIMRDKSWTGPLLDTIDGNIDAQKGIAEETDNLKEKLKDAKVFHSILDRAKKSMDEAGKVMDIRRTEGKDRRYIEEDPDKRMDKEELKMEVDWHDDTLRYQKHALKRLDNLLDSIKEEIAKMDEKKERERNNPPDPDKMPPEDNNNPPPRPGDGIPPMAQLKALRAEQADLLERTEKFAKDHKGKKIPDELNDPAKEELQRLSDEQTELHRLFQEILPAQQPMPQPEQKEQKEEKKGAPK